MPWLMQSLPTTQAELKGAFAEQEKLLRESTRIFEYWSAKIGELQLPDFEM